MSQFDWFSHMYFSLTDIGTYDSVWHIQGSLTDFAHIGQFDWFSHTKFSLTDMETYNSLWLI